MLLASVSNLDVIGWTCFVVGVAVLGCGVYIGLTTKVSATTDTAKDKLKAADQKIEEAKEHLATTKAAVADTSGADATQAATSAGVSADAAKTALEQVQGIIGSLPETLRFAGLLVLVGTVLIGVATTQFGGVSLF